MPATIEMNYLLTCQINNDPIFSGLLSPCPTYRFWRGGAHITLIFLRVMFIVLDMRPLAELNRVLFVVILRIVYGKFKLFHKNEDPLTLH